MKKTNIPEVTDLERKAKHANKCFSAETKTPDRAEKQSKGSIAITFVTSKLYRCFSYT